MKKRAGELVDHLHWSQYEAWNVRKRWPKYDVIRFEKDVPAEAFEACVFPLVLHHAPLFLFHKEISKDLLDRLGVFLKDTKKPLRNYSVYKLSGVGTDTAVTLANRALAEKLIADRMKK